MRPVIFLNGPPRAGKDTLGEKIIQSHPNFEIVKFAWELKERTHALYGRPELPHDHFEDVKDEPSAFFMGKSPRQAYIGVSERYFKPVHGKKVFGDMLVSRIEAKHSFARGYVITDSGFEEEAMPMLDHFGRSNCILVRIHGRGTYANDSRSMLDLPIETIDVYNTYGVGDFLRSAEFQLNRILQPMLAGEFI